MADREVAKTERALARALATIERGYREATAAIAAAPDLQTAFRAATRLAGALGGLRQAAAELRAQIAVRIRDTEALSLAGLARRVGISKARAEQLVKAGRVDQGSDGGEG